MFNSEAFAAKFFRHLPIIEVSVHYVLGLGFLFN